MRAAIKRIWPYGADVTIVLLLVIGGILLLWPDVARANVELFDEPHYLRVARFYAEGSYVDPHWGPDDPRPWNFEHPPLAKYAIAISIQLFGDNPAAWRLPSVLTGAFGYAGVYLLARYAFRSQVAGVAAAGFLAMDPMYYIHARLAMLEVFPAAFTAWSAAMLLDPAGPRLKAAGAFLGLGVACKYTTLFFAPPLLILALVRLRRNPIKQQARDLAIGLAAVPATILLATYLPYLALWTYWEGPLFALQELTWVQTQMFAHGYGAQLTHAYTSGPIGWFLLTVPVYYYYQNPPGPTIGWIYTVGNPAIWWPAIAAILTRVATLLKQPFPTYRLTQGTTALGILFLTGLLPYFFLDRILLNFYAVPYTPLLAATAGGLTGILWRTHPVGRFLAILFAATVAATWIVYYPLASGVPVHQEQVEWIFERLPWTRRLPVDGVWTPG